MACILNSGAAIGCSDSLGGVLKVYVLGSTGSTDPSLGELVYDADGAVTGTTGDAGDWFEFDVKRGTSSLTETVNKSFENGTVFYGQEVVMALYKRDVEKRNILKLLAASNDLKMIVVDQNNTQFLVGIQNGAYLSAGSAETGLALGDKNGYSLTFLAEEPEPSAVIEGDLETVFASCGFPANA